MNRLDEIIMFKPLTRENITGIVDILLARLAKRLEEENLKLEVTQKAKDYIADSGYDNIYGARPLKRFIQTHAETPIAKYIIGSNPAAGTTITLDANEEGLYIK